MEGYQRLGPEPAQQLDLLLGAFSPDGEIGAKRLIFDIVPAHPDAEAEPAAGKEIQRRRLLGDQHRLALRRNQNAGDKFDTLGRRRHIGETD